MLEEFEEVFYTIFSFSFLVSIVSMSQCIDVLSTFFQLRIFEFYIVIYMEYNNVKNNYFIGRNLEQYFLSSNCAMLF